jgi:hypothetical protein
MWDWLLVGAIMVVVIMLLLRLAAEVGRYFEQARRREP